jgi:non-specific serine/threonine protein kinase
MKLSPRQREAMRIVADGRFYPDLVKEDDGWHARWRSFGDDANAWVDEYVRSSIVTPLSADAEERKFETLHDAWIMALRSRSGLVLWDDAECARFAEDLAEWHGGGEEDTAVRKGLTFRFESDKKGFRVRCEVPRARAALRALGQAAYVFGPLRELKMDGGSLSTNLSHGEAERFVNSGARELVKAGYSVSGVDIAASVAASAEIDAPLDDVSPAASARLRIKVAGEEVSAEEIRFLLDQGSSLVYFRDHWIEVDRGILKEALRALEKSGGMKLSRAEAVSFASGIGRVGRLEIEEVASHGWLRGLVGSLIAAGQRPLGDCPQPEGLQGTLRDYQRRGAAWMGFLTDNGFGALLADDMGLGKTIQTIAWLMGGQGPALVVAPLTLLSNWRHEIAKFAPGLKVYVHQGDSRHIASGFRKTALESDIVVTSYSLLVRDYRDISEVEWQALVLDEAQAIKNPDTQVARAVRALGVKRRVALTGTPVENSASDIWSLEEFLNPGFLGDRKSFAERFLKPIGYDPGCAAAKKLRHALEPFILRRLKSDESIARELGPKREIREYCSLAPAERAEYESALEDFRSGERRQGDVFALITRLKLICDGDGKFARLVEILESVVENGESALVFTQYAKVGARLKTLLEERFRRKVQFLHGGLSAKEREREVVDFNNAKGPSIFVLSLRAGGFGLNLVKAAHVIHYDRWWNPAVESQATDRAHRIGQTKMVLVHMMVTEGTLEEHVDDILQSKSALADSLVTGGESFLARMTAADFDGVVSLDPDSQL